MNLKSLKNLRSSPIRQAARHWKILTVAAVFVAAWWVYRAGQDPHQVFLNGMEAAKSGDAETAFHNARQLLKITGFEAHGHMLRGSVFLNTQQYDAAANEFDLATRDPSLRAAAYTRCGEALYRMQRFVDAEVILLQALESDEANWDARRWLASTYYDLGAMTNALEQLQLIGINNPKDGRPYRLRGLIKKDFELYDEAIVEYETALNRELPPSERDSVLIEYSECLVHQLRFDEALKTLASALPTAKSVSLEAQCHAALGHKDDAVRLADEALALNPNDVAAILTKTSIVLESGQPETVLPLLRETASRHPNDFDTLFQLVKALRLTGHTEEADRQSPRLDELNRLMDEFSDLHQQAFADVSNADLRFQIGRIALRLDRPKLARSWLKAALAIDGSHAEAKQLLSSLPQDLRNGEE